MGVNDVPVKNGGGAWGKAVIHGREKRLEGSMGTSKGDVSRALVSTRTWKKLSRGRRG